MLLNERLVKLLETRGTIKFNQIGFRKGFRTADHVFTLKTLIDNSFSQKEKLYTCFVDFKKAYDTIWRNALFFKMAKENISTKFINIMRSMYSKLSVKVVLPDGLSSTFLSDVGLKQGCNLRPTLFNLFINDLISKCESTENCEAPTIDGIPVNCQLYADDLVLLSRSKQGLQNILNT